MGFLKALRFSKLIPVISQVGFFFFGAILLVAPMNQFERVFPEMVRVLSPYYNFLLFVFLTLAVIAHLTGVLFQLIPANKIEVPETIGSIPEWQRKLLLIAVLCLVWRALLDISAPLDVDELQQSAKFFKRTFWQSVLPVRDDIHGLAHFFSILSMKFLGVNKIALRIPSILFSVFLGLSLVYAVCRKYLGFGTGLLLLVHLSVNEFTRWYFHSARGYSSTMAITFIPLMFILKLTSQKFGVARKDWVLFSVFSTLAFCGHFFGAVYCLMLVFTLIQWMFLNRDNLKPSTLTVGRKIIQFGIWVLPIFVGILVHIMIRLKGHGDFSSTGTLIWFSEPFAYFGLSFNWAGKLLVVLVVCLCSVMLFQGNFFRDFLSLFLLNATVIFISLFLLLNIHHVEVRWFLPFLIPFVLWVGETLSRIKNEKLKWGLGVFSLICLVFLPVQQGYATRQSLALQYQGIEDFIAQIKMWVGPIERNCFYFPEVATNPERVELFHFYSSPKTPEERAKCEGHYTVFLGQGTVSGVAESDLELLLERSPGMKLFRGRFNTGLPRTFERRRLPL